jgi:hypothetical protein
MANKQTGKSWLIDTAGATSIKTGAIYIGDIEWHPVAAADVITVLDSRGDTIWTKTAIAATPAGDEHWKNPTPNSPFDGFNVSVLTGTAYVTVI